MQLGGEVADVVDAVRMLVHIHPSLSRAGIGEAGHFASKRFIMVRPPSIGVVAQADVAGNAAHALRLRCPARFPFVLVEVGNLGWRDVFVRRAFEEIFGFGKVRSEVGISVIKQVV